MLEHQSEGGRAGASGWHGWRRRIRAYGTAVMLTAAIVGSAPSGVTAPATAIVRWHARRNEREFDPVEVVRADLVLTMPLASAGDAVVDRAALN